MKQKLLLRMLESSCVAGVDGRVCGAHCTITCPECGSTACQCMCTHDCPNHTKMLSSEGASYPIEPKIASLVLELRRTGLFIPCWSCEGHYGTDGKLWKLPRVWFTCESVLHLRLFADMLKTLEHRTGLSAHWNVKAICSGDNDLHSTFELQPSLDGEPLDLMKLQADAKTIACALPSQFKQSAAELLGKMAVSAEF